MRTTQKPRFRRQLTHVSNRTIVIAVLVSACSTAFTLLMSGCTTYSVAQPSYAQASAGGYGPQLVWAPPPTDPSRFELPKAPRYSTSEAHTVTEILSQGRFFVLEDNTVWMVDASDTHDTADWLPLSKIAILETEHSGYIFHDLIELDDGESASATYLGTVALRTNINGKFEGWEGDTVFSLNNGQQVKQIGFEIYYYYAYMPIVLFVNIGVPGFYEMIVDGVQEKICVYVLR